MSNNGEFSRHHGYTLGSPSGYSLNFTDLPVKMAYASAVGVTVLFNKGVPTGGTLSLQTTNEKDDPAALMTPRDVNGYLSQGVPTLAPNPYMAPGIANSGGIAWATVTGTSVAVTSTGIYSYDVGPLAARYIRVVLTGNVGTCLADVWVSTKRY